MNAPTVGKFTLNLNIPLLAFFKHSTGDVLRPHRFKGLSEMWVQSPFSEQIPPGHMEPREFKERRLDPRSLFPYFSDHPRTTPLPDLMEILRRIGDESFYQLGRKIPQS